MYACMYTSTIVFIHACMCVCVTVGMHEYMHECIKTLDVYRRLSVYNWLERFCSSYFVSGVCLAWLFCVSLLNRRSTYRYPDESHQRSTFPAEPRNPSAPLTMNHPHTLRSSRSLTELADGRTVVRTDGRTDGRMDGWTDGRKDGQRDEATAWAQIYRLNWLLLFVVHSTTHGLTIEPKLSFSRRPTALYTSCKLILYRPRIHTCICIS